MATSAAAAAAMTGTVTVGTRLIYDGEVLTVVGVEAQRLRLRDGGGATMLMHTATLLAAPRTRLMGAADAEVPVGALAPLLDGLGDAERAEVVGRARHVREMLTGYASGLAEVAASGEPRAAYHPSLPLTARYRAKAAELGVTERTLRRWAAAVRDRGAAGLVDGRSLRSSDPLAGVDARWLAMCRLVLDEHVDASRPTKDLVLARIAARVRAHYGEGVVVEPGRRRAHAVLRELTRGTNTFVGSTSGKRSIANRPKGAYGRLRPTRPGEFVLLDSTPLDVFAMEPVTLRWVRVELTVALDLYSRSVVGLRLSPVSTKSVDAAVVLYEALLPETVRGTGGGLLPYAGVPDVLVIEAPPTGAADGAADGSGVGLGAGLGDGAAGWKPRAGLPGVAAEAIVVDHGKIYLSEHLLGVCARLGISVAPARPLTPTDKAAIERFFKTLREGLLAALPGYKGPDVYGRGKDPQGCTYFFIDELETVIRQWITTIYHQRPHQGLVEAAVPGLDLSPAEMFDHGITRAGRLRVPARPDLVFDLLPVAWRTIQHYGVEVNGLRYNGAVLCGYRNRRSPFCGVHAGKWPVRFDPDDMSRVFFQDPADNAWHPLVWEHATEVGMPFAAETLAYARRLAVAQGRHVDDRLALAELLERWDAGLVRHPAERRMAVRASQQRQARLQALQATTGGVGAAEVAGLPEVRAVLDACGQPPPGAPPDAADQAAGDHGVGGHVMGDDDSDTELDASAADEPTGTPGVDDEQFYADALEVLR